MYNTECKDMFKRDISTDDIVLYTNRLYKVKSLNWNNYISVNLMPLTKTPKLKIIPANECFRITNEEYLLLTMGK